MQHEARNRKTQTLSAKRLAIIKGFTLIELLVVVGIIGLLVGLGTSYYSTAQKKARDSQRRSDLKQLQQALELYRQDKTAPIAYPTESGVNTLGSCSGILGDAPTPAVVYLQKIACDPGSLTPTPYYYNVDNTNLTYTVCACLEAGSAADSDCSDCSGLTCTANKCTVVKVR